jgi:hypothetical protein
MNTQDARNAGRQDAQQGKGWDSYFERDIHDPDRRDAYLQGWAEQWQHQRFDAAMRRMEAA